MSTRSQRRQLSDILVDEGLVTKEQATEANGIQNTTGETLCGILVDMGSITPHDVAKVICMHFQVPFVSFRNYEFDSKLCGLFPPDFLHQHKILPFDSVGKMLLCAVAEIPSGSALAEIPKITKRKVALYVTYLEEIDKHLQEHCPLPEDSELLQRRKHIRLNAGSASAEPQAASSASGEVFSENELMNDLDSTWENIFDAVAKGTDEDGETEGSEDQS